MFRLKLYTCCFVNTTSVTLSLPQTAIPNYCVQKTALKSIPLCVCLCVLFCFVKNEQVVKRAHTESWRGQGD